MNQGHTFKTNIIKNKSLSNFQLHKTRITIIGPGEHAQFIASSTEWRTPTKGIPNQITFHFIKHDKLDDGVFRNTLKLTVFINLLLYIGLIECELPTYATDHQQGDVLMASSNVYVRVTSLLNGYCKLQPFNILLLMDELIFLLKKPAVHFSLMLAAFCNHSAKWNVIRYIKCRFCGRQLVRRTEQVREESRANDSLPSSNFLYLQTAEKCNVFIAPQFLTDITTLNVPNTTIYYDKPGDN